MTGTFDINTSTTANRYFRINGDGNFIFNGEIRNNSTGVTTSTTGAGGLNRSTQGSGVLTLNGANTFTGGVILGGGTINLGSAENAGTNGPLGASGSIVLNGGYLQYSANNQYDYSSRFDNANSSPQKYNVDTNGQNVTWATSLTSANGSLTKIGNGTLTLSATNSYGGGTTLQAGVLQLNNSNSLGTSGTITLSGGTLQYTVNDTNDYSSRFSTAASQKYNFDTNGVNITAATALTSLGGTLTKSGNGILTLGGSNTYTGDTTVNQGTLTAGIVAALSSSSAVVVSSGATLNLNSNNQTLKGLAGAGTVTMGTANLTIADGDSRTFSGDISGSGNLIKSGSGTQTLSAAVTYTGSTAINAGTLRVNNSLASSSITVDGTDLRRFGVSDWRRNIGLVLQEPFLFFGTIAENIAYGRPDATRQEIVAAARAARAHDFILRLPHGYDSQVGERGQGLSGGERQRISIARALLIDPRILILDEATSSVDTETEKEIQAALDNLVRGRTTIAIAHRISTLRKADRIVVLDRGQVVEVGPHDELMAKRQAYWRIHEAQSRGMDESAQESEAESLQAPARNGRDA